MSVQQALEARIRADLWGWDDWRVYADWLLEQGDVRGELIGLEHRLATAALSEPERRAARSRIRALVAEHRTSWLAGLVVPRRVKLHWHHGFVVGVSLPWSPRSLDALQRVLAHPVAPFLALLFVEGRLGPEGAAVLAASDALCSLTFLSIGSRALGVEGARVLAASAHLRSLNTLALQGDAIGDEGAQTLAGSEHLRSLTALYLRDNRIGVEGARALAASDTLRSLTRLDLEDNPVGEEGAEVLARFEDRTGCQVNT